MNSKRTVHIDVGKSRIHLLGDNNSLSTILRRSHPALLTQIRNLLKRNRVRPHKVVVGLAGVWSPKDRRAWKKQLSTLAPKVQVTSDVELAHRWVFKGKPGILINCGTGSIAYGQRTKGRWARSGGLGPPNGDEGSAYWIGRECLRKGLIKNKKKKILNNVSRLAREGFQMARHNETHPNPRVSKILSHAQNHLASLIWDTAEQLRWKKKVPLGVWGAVFNLPKFRKGFYRALLRPFNSTGHRRVAVSYFHVFP